MEEIKFRVRYYNGSGSWNEKVIQADWFEVDSDLVIFKTGGIRIAAFNVGNIISIIEE